MNKNLEEIIKIYSTKTHKDFLNELIGFSKDNLIAIFSDLLTIYINDKNSSSIREFITVSMAGYTHNTKKIGFNGFKQTTSNQAINCEAKPRNFQIDDYDKYTKGLRKNPPQKLNGGGNFTDYTWARFEKDKNSNLNMLTSGFIDGQLIYILEFPFNTPSFTKNLENQLNKKFPNGDQVGLYLRSAGFNFKDYQSGNIQIKFIQDKDILNKFKNFIDKNLFNFLYSGEKNC